MSHLTLLPPAEQGKTKAQATEIAEYLHSQFAKGLLKFLAVDTETTGLNIAKDYAVLLALSDGVRRFCVWPKHIRLFKDLLEDPSIILLMANAKFDMWMLANIGIDVWAKSARNNYKVYDIQVMHHLWCNWHPHSLKWLAKRFLEIEMVEFSDVFGIRGKQLDNLYKILLDPANEEVATNYASLDAFVTYELFFVLKELLEGKVIDVDKHPQWLTAFDVEPHLQKKNEVTMYDYFVVSEAKFTRVLYECERNGLPLDLGKLHEESARLAKELHNIERWFAGRLKDPTMNLGNDNYMRKFFYERMGYKHQKVTDGGQKSLDKEVLQDWELEYGCEYVQKYKVYKNSDKILGTYVSQLARFAHNTREGCRIHPTLRQTGTDTGRLASASPNLQNLPGYIRFVFAAPEGYVLAAPDFAQLEVRLMAHVANDTELIGAIKSGRDLHAETANIMFPDVDYDSIIAAKKKSDRIDEKIFKGEEPLEKLSDHEKTCLKRRKAAKTITFGLAYGQGVNRLANSLNVSTDHAKELIRTYFKAFAGVKDYFEDAIEEASETGYSYTFMGRRRELPHYFSHLKGDVARAQRQTKNSPIQGGASDIVKWAMIRLWEDETIAKSGTKMLLQVHDEVVLQVPEEWADKKEFAEHIEAIMAEPMYEPLRCPLRADMKYGRHYGACK